ncbi:MAG: STAS domain-containing protein [Planctomycetota bacterium]
MGNSPIIVVVQQGTTAVISIPHPVISADQAEQLGDGFMRTIAALPSSTATVHLDVAEVVGMSSGGFEALLALRRSCESRKLKLTVSQLQPTFHRLLARMGFLRLLGISG